VGRQRRYATYRIPFVGFACACLLSGSLAAAANPETVSVQVTFVDPVAIRQADEALQGTPTEVAASLLIDGSSTQASTVTFDPSDDGDLTITFH
jgi:hypothetical protein